MTTPRIPFDVYITRQFFAAETCRKLIAEMRQSSTMPALTYGKGDALLLTLDLRLTCANDNLGHNLPQCEYFVDQMIPL